MAVELPSKDLIAHDGEPHSLREHIDDLCDILKGFYLTSSIDRDLLELHVTAATRKSWIEGVGRWNFMIDDKYQLSFELDKDNLESAAFTLSEKGRLNGKNSLLSRAVMINVTEISTGKGDSGIRCLVGKDQEVGMYYYWKDGPTFYNVSAKNVPF